MDNIFIQLSFLLATTTVIAFAVRLLRQPLIIGYIIAGIICGPLFLDVIHGGRELYDAFAQFGVILLLFVIGLNLDLKHLKEIGKVSFITGLGQVIFTMVIGWFILTWLGFAFWSAVFLAGAITFSSTIIIMKLLTEKKATETVYGRHTIGLMLVQDIIAISMIIAIGLFETKVGATSTLILFLIKALVLSGIVFLFSKYALPRFLESISSSSEMLFLFTIAWCFGVSSLFHLANFSIEIGAIVAGMSLASSPYRLEIGSRIRALRDFFLVLFFIVLGAQMGLGSLSEILVPSLVLSLFILIGNPLILYILFRLLKFTRRNSFLAGLTAAQVSEFGFVLLFSGSTLGLVSGKELSVFTAVAIITIFISSYLIIYNDKIYKWLLPFFKLFGNDKYRQSEKVTEKYDAWVVGYHRIGAHVVRSLLAQKLKVAVIDYDPAVSKRLSDSSAAFFFGDISDVEFIENLPMVNSKLVVLTIPGQEDQLTVIENLKQANSEARIVANAYQYKDIEALYDAGADYVMMPHLVGGDWIAGILGNGDWSKESFAELKKEQSELLGSKDILFT